MKTASLTLCAVTLVAALVASAIFVLPKAHAATATSLTGYAWSDTIGWIDLNCSNTNSCGTNNWGFAVGSTGAISGYAWSDNIGWVSANASDVAGCPSGTCEPTLVDGVISGWLKALSGGSDQSAGWDGWISLKGSSPAYGIAVQSDGRLSGFGWGSDVVGWVDFSFAQLTDSSANVCTASTSYNCADNHTIARATTDKQCQTSTTYISCASPTICVTGSSTCVTPSPTIPPPVIVGHLQVLPSVVSKGATTNISWNVKNVASCSVSGTNGDSWSGNTGAQTSSLILNFTTYTLSCTGLDGSSVHETAAVNIVPAFQER